MKIKVWTFGWDTTADGTGSASFGTEKEAWAEYIDRTFNTKFGAIDEDSDEYPKYQEARELLEEEDFDALSDLLRDEVNHMDTFSGPDSTEIEVPAPPTAVKPRIVVVIEGGAMQQVLASAQVDVALIDYDTDGCDDEQLMRIPQGEDKFADAVGHVAAVQIMPERIAELFPIVERQDAWKWGYVDGSFVCPSCGRKYEREGKPAKDASYNGLLEIFRVTGHCCEACASQDTPAVPVELKGLEATVDEAEMARYDAPSQKVWKVDGVGDGCPETRVFTTELKAWRYVARWQRNWYEFDVEDSKNDLHGQHYPAVEAALKTNTVEALKAACETLAKADGSEIDVTRIGVDEEGSDDD